MAQRVQEVLKEYDPWFKSYSLDEAYMDLKPYFELRIEKGWCHEEVAKLLRKQFVQQQPQPEPQPQPQNTQQEKQQRSNPTNSDEEDEHDEADLPTTSTTSSITPAQILAEMRAKVYETTGLTCSASLASNHMLAKIASDINKPNGQLCIGPSHDEIMEFIRPLPVRKIPGIGRVME